MPWLNAWIRTDRVTRARLSSYPRNHSYLATANSIIPGLRLHARWRRIAALYPEPLTSLLDVGSCKGYFVLEAARRPTCRTALGIDVYEPFISLSRNIAGQIGLNNAQFYFMNLNELAAKQASLGGPFQTVLLLNVYHYLFWGSELNPLAFKSHRSILEMLHAVCSDRVIFSSPLELTECPGQVQRAAEGHPNAETYTRRGFMEAASEFFTVTDEGTWGRRPLLTLRKK